MVKTSQSMQLNFLWPYCVVSLFKFILHLSAYCIKYKVFSHSCMIATLRTASLLEESLKSQVFLKAAAAAKLQGGDDREVLW